MYDFKSVPIAMYDFKSVPIAMYDFKSVPIRLCMTLNQSLSGYVWL